MTMLVSWIARETGISLPQVGAGKPAPTAHVQSLTLLLQPWRWSD